VPVSRKAPRNATRFNDHCPVRRVAQEVSEGPQRPKQLRPHLHSPIGMKLMLCLLALAVCVDAVAQQPGTNPNQWVRQAIDHELQAEQQDTSHWKFLLKNRKSNGNFEVDQVVETAQGDLKRPLIINGRKLSAKESDQRMEKMLHDQDALQKSQIDKNDDTAKSQQMLKILPDAFLFKYAERRGELVELSFSPNPKFKPPTREAEVFHAMVGNLWFNTKDTRLQAINGRLNHEVKFGGGILGHLDRGGNFNVKQAEVAPGYWELTVLNVTMKGKALFFKTIDVQQKMSRSGFLEVSNQTSAQQGAAMLKQGSSQK
jgi:hypothetical protein